MHRDRNTRLLTVRDRDIKRQKGVASCSPGLGPLEVKVVAWKGSGERDTKKGLCQMELGGVRSLGPDTPPSPLP